LSKQNLQCWQRKKVAALIKQQKKKKIKKAAVKKSIPLEKEVKKKKVSKGVLQKAEFKKTKIKREEQVKDTPVQVETNINPAKQAMATDTGKKRLMVSYEKLPPEVIEAIRTKYPYGYNHDLREVKGIDNKKFFVLPIDLPDVIYLIKVDLRKPIQIQDTEEEEEEEDIFTPEEEFAGEEDNFPAEDLEQIEGDDEDDEDEKKKKMKKDDED